MRRLTPPRFLLQGPAESEQARAWGGRVLCTSGLRASPQSPSSDCARILTRVFKWIPTVCLAVSVGACAGGVDPSTEFPDTPFRSIQGVTLGMKAQDLRLARPEASFAPYRGFSEMLDTIWIGYQFPARSVWSSGIEDRARLTRIDAQISKPSLDAAFDEWRQTVASAISRGSTPLRCEYVRGVSSGVNAIWKKAGVWFVVSARGPHPSANDATTDRVIFTVSMMDPARLNPGEREQASCRALIGH